MANREQQGFGLIAGAGISGFKHANYSTYSALAEIIDNSIQAQAKNVHIIDNNSNFFHGKADNFIWVWAHLGDTVFGICFITIY